MFRSSADDAWQSIADYQDLYLQVQADEAIALTKASQYQDALQETESQRDIYRDDYKLSCEVKRQQTQIDEMQHAAVGMEYEIMRLKAKLYDAIYGIAI